MEFSGKGQRNTLMFAVLTLLIIGVSLVFSTWQILRQQEESSLQHLAMSGRAISQAVENTLRRHMHGPVGMDASLMPTLQDFLENLEGGGNIRFIQIIDAQGVHVLNSRPDASYSFFLSPPARAMLAEKGEWFGLVQAADERVFVFAKTVRPRSGVMMRRRLLNATPTMLVIGLGMDDYQHLYNSFRNNALLQSLYILAAALFVWGMAVSLIARRSIVGKARMLERFQAELLDNLPDGLITLGPDNVIQAANPAAHELLDFRASSLVGKSLTDLPEEFVRLLQVRDIRDGIVGWRQAEVGGKQLEVMTSSFQGEDEKPVMLLLIRNRTRLHNLERSLAEAEKMAAVGTLAAGVAHEIRNPLSALRGFAQYFAKKFSGQKPDEEFANTMVREADRLNRVITDLLYLARNKKPSPVELPVSALIYEVEKLLRFELENRGVTVEHDFRQPTVLADPDATKQALLNLMLNSIDALEEKRMDARPETDMHKGAVFRPDAADADISASANALRAWKPQIVVRSYAGGEYTVLELEDNGVGMDGEQTKQAFEAFFTSKAKGTGLGLSLVQKTMREHGGKAEMQTRKGEFCRVRLFFPAHGVNVDPSPN